MYAKGPKFVRFADSSPESSFSIEQQNSSNGYEGGRKLRTSVSSVLKSIRRRIESGSENIRSFRKSSAVHPGNDGPPKKGASGRKIFDPQGSVLQKWNKVFVITCVLAVSVDPLFFYIPMINGEKKCLELHEPLQTTVCVLRTFFDLFYVLHIIFQFKTGFIAPSSRRVFGRGELIDDPLAIIKRYLCSHFIIDILSIIPIPQVVVLFIIPKLKEGSLPFVAKELLKYVILVQYVPRLVRIIPLFKEVTRTSGILTETAWAGAVFNLFVYMLGSHVVGAFWYLFSVETGIRCWRRNLRLANMSDKLHLSCVNVIPKSLEVINRNCTLTDPDDIKDSANFNFGIFIDALTSQVVESSKPFAEKFFYCFWWGLRNVSSVGQNLKTSTFVWEILFAISIAILGLVLFASLIGNMQKYLQSTAVRVEEMRVKRQDAEQWMSHRMLPDSLKDRIRRYEHYKWQQNRGVEEETLIRNLPKDLRRDIKRHLCLNLLKKVPMFEKMDEQLLDAFVTSQFRRLHSKQLQHTFRFYSVQWRTWGACFIQAAWRRYCKKKVERSLREAEDRLQDALANEEDEHTPSLGATIFASRFAANAMRNLRQNGERRNRFPQRMLPLLPQKPAEPDFSA
ncbi:hypothetical protein L6164_021220 [Bauhinia variegata]|uniref:Uncharacterized protein n=1 Tax=Bauhinia variegata TaxID=167791 RepID=A0ACB9MXH8_BAUVA|nr:hypothetical protein L6164_021220 [Bauhinia variegata]